MTNELIALHRLKGGEYGKVNLYEADMYAYDRTIEVIKARIPSNRSDQTSTKEEFKMEIA